MHDAFIAQADTALRTLFNVGTPQRANPAQTMHSELSYEQTRMAAGFMRVNHVGEVCAQGLYAGQGLVARSPETKKFNAQAAQEERDHLLWCKQRLVELDARPSLLNPVWYLGAFALGAAAGLLGDRTSLAFVRETETQVEAHLHKHREQLPAADARSLAIVASMQNDEAEHAAQAMRMGAPDLPKWVQGAMRLSAKTMTATAYYI
jgi:3-demethoxyubiquinol 3-hydroxylase